MRILVLGGDGYLGWPTSMYLAVKGHEVFAIDNYLRRTVALATNSEALIPSPNLEERAQTFKDVTGSEIGVRIGDLRDIKVMEEAINGFKPDAVIHYAEQPSAPYSMMGYDEALLTLDNNLKVTFNLVWSVINHRPECHIIKLGTMGEYGTPEIDIEEGWIEIEHKGRRGRFLFPRQAGSLYHTTKIMDTDLLWFYVRTFGLTVTDLMQGPVYGLSSDETELDPRLLPNFHYDDIFGTVINRFLVQAVAGEPLTVYGAGGQTRGYPNLRDPLQCVELAALNAPEKGTLRVFNQLTECFTVNEIAERIQRTGNRMRLDVKIERIDNPRKEAEQHYYNPVHTGLLELGLKPHHMTDEVLDGMLETILPYKERINRGVIQPRVRWS